MKYLIESVRKHPCLWKADSPDYKNVESKKEAWLKVIQDCDLPDVKEAKSLWKNLRDGHRQAISRKGISSAKWKYEQQMEFILPWMTKRNQQNDDTIDMTEFLLPNQSNVINTPHEQDIKPNDDNLEITDIFPPCTNATNQSNIINTPQTQDFKQNIGNMGIMTILLPSMTNINTPQEQESQQDIGDMERHEIDNNCLTDLPLVKRELVSPIEIEQEIRSVETDSSNLQFQTRKTRKHLSNAAKAASQKIALETFFSSMCQTTSNLSVRLQMRVQRSIFNVVMEAREEVLKDRKLHPVAGSSNNRYNVHNNSEENGTSSSN